MKYRVVSLGLWAQKLGSRDQVSSSELIELLIKISKLKQHLTEIENFLSEILQGKLKINP